MEQISEGKQIRIKLKILGYEKGRVPLEIDDKLLTIARRLLPLKANELVPNKGTLKINPLYYKSITSEFLKDKFRFHDIKHISQEETNKIVAKYIENGFVTKEGIKKILEEMHIVSKNISPFDLPVNLVNGHSMVGDVKKSLFIVDDEEVIKKHDIYFQNINLGSNITALTPATYSHELFHTQLESIKGYAKNYHNKEVITVFMEKVLAYECYQNSDVIKKSELMRFRHLSECIVSVYQKIGNRSEILENSVYVESILKAEELFDIYINCIDSVKKEMLNDIQKIIDGKQTVEDMLQKYDVTLSKSTNLKLLEKHMY